MKSKTEFHDRSGRGKEFSPKYFEKIDGKYTGNIGKPVSSSGIFIKNTEASLLGTWTFGHLLGNMVGEQDDPMDFFLHFISQWKFDQTINGWLPPIRKFLPEIQFCKTAF